MAESNPMNYTWFESHPRPDGNIDVYAGSGEQSYQDLLKYGPQHGHFVVGPNNEDVYGRSGPRGSTPDYSK